MVLDPTDARAAHLSLHRGVADREALETWQILVDATSPDIVIDVGANYGEFLLAITYRHPPLCVAVEANPRVAARLAESLSRSELNHVLVCVALSSDRGQSALHVDATWSGFTKTEYEGEAIGQPRLLTLTLDDLVDTVRSNAAWQTENGPRILLKIDVEGNEVAVLKGAMRTLNGYPDTLVLAEVDHLSGEDRDWLNRNFNVFRRTAGDFRSFELGRERRALDPKDVVLALNTAALGFLSRAL